MAEWPQLGYVVRGFKKKTAGPRRRARLPITPPILQKLRVVWERMDDAFNRKMLWAAVCMCFFGCLRSGEVVVPSASSFDPAIHLSEGDVLVDRRDQPSLLKSRVRRLMSFRKG